MADADYRNAARILFIIAAGAVPNRDPATSASYPYRFDGETRLQALDFWVRYPDYLADELIDLYQSTDDGTFLDSARSIFADDEPSERLLPMLRRYYGAYENLVQPISILSLSDLVKQVTTVNSVGQSSHTYMVSEHGKSLTRVMVEQYPILGWYARRASLVVRVGGGRGGSDLKSRQHQQKEYHLSNVGDLIPSISERVKERLERILA